MFYYDSHQILVYKIDILAIFDLWEYVRKPNKFRIVHLIYRIIFFKYPNTFKKQTNPILTLINSIYFLYKTA